MYTQLIEFATPQYDESVRLRDIVLRQPLGLDFFADDLAKEYDSHHLACYNDQGKLLGICILKPINKRVLKMRQVAVDPHKQRLGVGTLMMKSAESIAVRKGYNKIELNARDAAIPFYTRLDYQSVGEKFEEVGIPHYKMEKKLS